MFNGTEVMKTLFVLVVAGFCFGSYAEMRTWTFVDGNKVDAEYEKVVIDKVWLKNSKGDRFKVSVEQLSEEDRSFVQLLNPPRLKVEFWSKSNHIKNYYKGTPRWPEMLPPSMFEYVFRVRVGCADSVDYNHMLTVQYYAIGKQLIDRDKYILFEKKSEPFLPSEQREIEFSGKTVKMREYIDRNQNRGHKFAHYLVVVTDERGNVVAHKGSAKWLFEHLEKLEKLPTGAYMDKTCTRVHPSGPEAMY